MDFRPVTGLTHLAPDVVANAPYVGRAPAPPSIPVPLGFGTNGTGWTPGLPNSSPGVMGPERKTPAGESPTQPCLDSDVVAIRPSLLNAGVLGLSPEDMMRIAGNRPQTIDTRSFDWLYESRRHAQPVLDFLYLGPSPAARDAGFIQREGITMVMAVRDSRFAQAQLLAVSPAVTNLGVEAQYVDISHGGDLMKALPTAIEKINAHMLQASGGASRRVLVYCETGNGRSAAVVAAYIMTMYGLDLVPALQFVNMRRFCANFDEDCKHMLEAYSDILQARRDVEGANATAAMPDSMALETSQALSECGTEDYVMATWQQRPRRRGRDEIDSLTPSSAADGILHGNETRPRLAIPLDRMRINSRSSSRNKRRIHETMDDDVDSHASASGLFATANRPMFQTGDLDMERYQNRMIMQPFKDAIDSDMS